MSASRPAPLAASTWSTDALLVGMATIWAVNYSVVKYGAQQLQPLVRILPPARPRPMRQRLARKALVEPVQQADQGRGGIPRRTQDWWAIT